MSLSFEAQRAGALTTLMIPAATDNEPANLSCAPFV